LAFDTSATESRLGRLLPPLVGVAALLTLVAPVFSPGVQLYYRDTGRLYYPVKLYIAQALSHWRLPLWDSMTEAGVSLLGQVTPGLLHPATLLYVALPFDFAFKVNALLGLALGGIGAFRLARRLGASRWAAVGASVAYGGCGYLISMTASNLPFALGAGTVPIAIHALLGFLDRGGPLPLGWAAVALARFAFANHPARLLGLFIPRAFDDVPERVEDPTAPWGRGTFAEYFTDLGAAFSDSIALGAPALLFAACAAFCGRRGRLVLGSAIL